MKHFAGLCGLENFWQNAKTGNNLQQQVPLGRWDIDEAYSPQMPPSGMTIYARHAAFCSSVELFDASAFRLTKPEAAATDPQQRLLMESSAEAIQEALSMGAAIGSSTGLTWMKTSLLYL